MAAAADAGVGEEDVDRAVVPLGLGDQMPDVGFLGDVAGTATPLISLATASEPVGIAVGHDHALGAFPGVAPRDRLADAARRAGDDADLVFDFHSSLPSKPTASSSCGRASVLRVDRWSSCSTAFRATLRAVPSR